MRKALQTIGLTLFIAVVTLAAMLYLFDRNPSRANLSPADVQTRALMPYLRDGQTFRLTDAYPDPWDSVQVIRYGDTLTDWTWRTLRAFNAELAQFGEGQELLVFWRDGIITSAVRYTLTAGGAPWFTVETGDGESLIISREKAVFRATLVHANGYDYYACVPEGDAAQI